MYIMVLELFNLNTFQTHSICNVSEVLGIKVTAFDGQTIITSIVFIIVLAIC